MVTNKVEVSRNYIETSQLDLMVSGRGIVYLLRLSVSFVGRDCMKGDETENKKIGCTVNLLVRLSLRSILCEPNICYMAFLQSSKSNLMII